MTEDPEGYIKEGSGGTSLFVGGQLGNLGWAHLPGTLRDRGRRPLEMERFSLLELCEGNLEGGLLYWGP